MSLTREQQFGFLKVATYVSVILAIVATAVWGGDLNLLLALIMIGGVAYAVLRGL